MRGPRRLTCLFSTFLFVAALAACGDNAALVPLEQGPADAGPDAPPDASACVNVDDGIACTMDLCDSATGVVTHVPVNQLCEVDGKSCSAPTCDPALGC